jgi:hypothetical protein
MKRRAYLELDDWWSIFDSADASRVVLGWKRNFAKLICGRGFKDKGWKIRKKLLFAKVVDLVCGCAGRNEWGAVARAKAACYQVTKLEELDSLEQLTPNYNLACCCTDLSQRVPLLFLWDRRRRGIRASTAGAASLKQSYRCVQPGKITYQVQKVSYELQEVLTIG